MRGFSISEFQARTQKAQKEMAAEGIDCLLLTTEPEIRYFTGFLTRFWESPTRPWFLVLPQSGKPVAVIPSIGFELMSKTWIDDIRVWTAPKPSDDGVGLLADTLSEVLVPSAKLGIPSGHETHLRMPLRDFEKLKAKLPSFRFADDAEIIRKLRLIKSPSEIKKISKACKIAGSAFSRIKEVAEQGVPLESVFRGFQKLCLEEGADWVPYLAGGAGFLGYTDVISPAHNDPLGDGDIIMLDTGLVYDGYFCDFDRNFSVGKPDPRIISGYTQLLEAVEAGKSVAQPGMTAADIFNAMAKILGSGKSSAEVGRLGHGLGMQLTEWPSLIPEDRTVLQEGMVITLEPAIPIPGGGVLVHEDNFVIGNRGLQQLSPVAPMTLEVI